MKDEMMDWKQFSEEFIHPQAVAIVLDAEVLRAEGQIGPSVIRQVGTMWHDNAMCTISGAMLSVATEAYRYLALKYVSSEAAMTMHIMQNNPKTAREILIELGVDYD